MNPIREEPKYAVLFISEREVDPAPQGYPEMDDATMKAVSGIDGFLGFDVARTGKDGIFISYWRDKTAIEEWKSNSLHQAAKAEGRARWYDAYRTVICKIESLKDFRRNL